jgi:hypothetical protein
MVMAVRRTTVNDSTYTIVDDYGTVYVVLWERSDGRQAYLVKMPNAKWGTDPVLGDDLLGEVFPCCCLFGIPAFRTTMAYSHRNHTRWKQFLGWDLHHHHSPKRARQMAQQAALKYKAEQQAA